MGANRLEMVQEARAAGLLLECRVCYSDEWLESDIIPCLGGHLFCNECVRQGTEAQVGEGRCIIKCLVPSPAASC